MRSHWVFAAPARHHIGKVWDTTPITGVHTRLPILAYAAAPGATAPGTTVPGTTAPGTTAPGTAAPGTTAPGTTTNGTVTTGTDTSNVDAKRWLLVRLPGRPNGHTGWIQNANVRIVQSQWHVVVSTWLRRVSVYRAGHFVRSFAAIVGKPSTPTPRGEFFVEEHVALPARAPGAPLALALSARSNVLQDFAGGPGQIAIHTINNIGGTLGTAVSHGCIRVSTAAVRWLAARIAAGTSVTIT